MSGTKQQGETRPGGAPKVHPLAGDSNGGTGDRPPVASKAGGGDLATEFSALIGKPEETAKAAEFVDTVASMGWQNLLAAKVKGLLAPEVELIRLLLPSITKKIGEIRKSRKVTSGPAKFQYRGIDDALNAVSPVLVAHGCHVSAKFSHHKLRHVVSAKKDGETRDDWHATVRLTLRFIAPDGSYVETTTIGEGQDYGSDRASQKAMAYAMKYALFFGLMIPIEANEIEDPDSAPPPPEDSDSPMVKQAKGFINNAPHLNALDKVAGRIEGSDQFTPAEKEILSMLVDRKRYSLEQEQGRE